MGSSVVTICFGAERFTRSSIAASVVNLPLSVAPVTRSRNALTRKRPAPRAT